MIEHTLGEGLSGGVRAELSVESEGLGDREVSLNSEHGGSWPLFFAEHLSTAFVQAGVDTTDGILRALDLDYIPIDVRRRINILETQNNTPR